jgi:hypothetical protein
LGPKSHYFCQKIKILDKILSFLDPQYLNYHNQTDIIEYSRLSNTLICLGNFHGPLKVRKVRSGIATAHAPL